MIHEDYLNHSEKLSSFLDGELDVTESENLFFEIAKNPELQEEMRSLSTIKNAFKNSLIPAPAALKANILNNIGLSDETVNPPASVGFWGRTLKSKAFLSICSLFLGSAITYLALNLNNQNNVTVMQPTQNVSNSIAKSPVPVSSSIEKEDKVSQNATKPIIKTSTPKSKKANFIISKPSDEIATANEIKSNKSNLPNEPANKYNFLDISGAGIRNESIPMNPKFNSPTIYSREPLFNGFLKDLVLQIRASSSNSYPNVNVSPLTNPLLNNFGCALMYKVSTHDYVGIEIGQENFMQKYNGVEDQEKVSYDQNYLAFWFAGVYQHNFDRIYVFKPYAKIVAGGTKVGPLAKATFGVNYDLNEKLSLFGGLENSCLVYKYQSNLFSTFKIGGTAGISIKFD